MAVEIDVSCRFILVDALSDLVIHGAETEEELLHTAEGYISEMEVGEVQLVIYEKKALLEDD